MTELPDVAQGATWRCVDFHLHTPGVPTFRLPAGSSWQSETGRAELVNAYVDALAAAGVDVGVVTDYQGVRLEWFLPIRERALQAGIAILPGAELSLAEGKGLHLLVVCGEDTDPESINQTIRHLDRDGRQLFGNRTPHEELIPRSNLEDTLRELRRQLSCVVIAAHAADEKGALKVLGAKGLARLVALGLIDGVDKCESIGEKLLSTGIVTDNRVSNLACTLSSDPKQLDDLGAKTLTDGRPRTTWVKLSSLSTPALRLALHDPKTRVLTRQPEPARHPRILSMEVDGGFLDGLKVRFNDDLTTLIGGRGAGKSAILETLRYALDGTPYSDQSERLSLVAHALGSGGRIRVVIERPGNERQRYVITRVYGQQSRVTDASDGRTLDVQPLELFGAGRSPVILLQREIQAVARDDAFRLRLVDEIIGDEARQADLSVRRLLEVLRKNTRAIEDAQTQLAQRDQHESRLHRLQAEIDFFDRQGVAEKLLRHTRTAADEARARTALAQIQDARALFHDGATSLLDALETVRSELEAAESDFAPELHALVAGVSDLVQMAGSQFAALADALQRLEDRIAGVAGAWPAHTAALAADLRRVSDELQKSLGAGSIDSQRYVTLVQERTALLPIMDSLSGVQTRLVQMKAERAAQLRQLQDQRRAAFVLRQRAAAAVNLALDGKLRMQVTYLGDSGEFKRKLLALLKGSRVTADAVEALAGSPGVDGVEVARVLQGGPQELQARFGVTQASALRMVDWFADEHRLHALEVLSPSDRISISLFVDGVARDLAVLSGGQKATALLLLLFAQGGRPLVLDQPEDDLDNRFVYEDVVALLRAEKGVVEPSRRRQIIAATHNANIPVNGDAESVISLSDEQGRCVVRTRSSIDDVNVREELRSVLEGGEEAFLRRAEKYGGIE